MNQKTARLIRDFAKENYGRNWRPAAEKLKRTWKATPWNQRNGLRKSLA